VDINQIKILASQGESEQLEYKKSTANLKDIFQTLCAFLNGDGGMVLIGVEDNGHIVGQEISDKTKREIGLEIAKISPYSDSAIEVFYIPFLGNRYLIAFHVTTDSTKRPYTYNGRASIRIQSTNVPMPTDHYQQLILNNAQYKDQWEDKLLSDVTINDLDTEEILSTIKEGIFNGRIPEGYATNDPEMALKHLGLMKDNQITRAAIILFGKKPEAIFPQCILRLARFKGNDKSEFLDNRQVHGNIFHLLRAAMSFANFHLPIASTFPKDSMMREDKPLFQIPVLREAITNALTHRDYSFTGGSVSFAIYDNRLEFWSYGLLPPGLAIEELVELNQSIPRNRRIANVLYYHKFFESWGRGIKLIIDGCVASGHPEPVYSINSGGLLLSMPFTLAKTSVTTFPLAKDLTAPELEILSLIEQNHSLSMSAIFEQITSEYSERWLRNTLNKLWQQGLIERSGKTKSTKWHIVKK